MKWTSLTLDLSRIRKFIQGWGVMARTFAVLSGCTLLFLVMVGTIGYAQTKWNTTPTSSMRGLAASVSHGFFMDMIGMEVPHLSETKTTASGFSESNVFGFVFRMLTDINTSDPKTLLAREVPGLGADTAVPLRVPGGGVGPAPIDYVPPRDAIAGVPTGPAATSSEPAVTPSPSASPDPQPSAKPTTNGRKVVLFYHSHNRESWVPELGIQDAKDAYDAEKNITLVGKRMAEKLEEQGIGSAHYSTDYAVAEKKYDFSYSYKYSLKTVKEAFAANPDIQFVFDVHRDSSARKHTTVNIGGKDYAQVYFIIGQRNPNWRKNESFASKLNERLEQKMPGISRGIWGKTPHDGNAEYNQSLSPNSVVIEVGGPFNTLEECYRTADVLTEVIAELYWDAEKVNAQAGGSDAARQ